MVAPDRVAQFFERKDLKPLKCQAGPLRPVLDFSFRFRAGYTVRVPLEQYRGKGHKWMVMVRVQPEVGGAPVYFLDRLNLPDVPDAKADGDAGGGYLLGTGLYRATFLLLDDEARACRADWNIEAQAGSGDRSVTMAIAPGAVQEISLRNARSVNSTGTAALGRLTVLLHAAPVWPRMSRVQGSDVVTLMGALSSLLDLAPARSVRLVVFNLEQQKEIYRHEQFTLDQLGAVRQAIFELQLATIDYRSLQNPAGHLDLLAHLVEQELNAGQPSDAVVFLGPRARAGGKRAVEVANGPAGMPKFFYVEYQPPLVMRPAGPSADEFARVGSGIGRQTRPATGEDGGSGWAVVPDSSVIDSINGPAAAVPPRDSIDLLVSMLKGKTLLVRTPADFAKAMGQITPQKRK